MRVEVEHRDVQISGAVATTAYTIEQSAKAYMGLIKGLYTWPEAAILRELMTNAYDSHVEAGKADIPFDVHIPHFDDPFFRVRDYGVGMSHETAVHVTTSFFSSTKEDSDDVVGRHGLGCKSPLSIGDTMTLIRFDGTYRHIYMTTLNEVGEPEQHQYPPMEDDSPVGIEFSIPVDGSRFRSFQRSAALILPGFDVRPNLMGAQMSSISLPETRLEGPGWRIYEDTPSMRKNQPYARQGCVFYPIDRDAVESAQIRDIPGDAGRITEDEKWILDDNAEIDFNIGKLRVPLSREGLEYDQFTLRNVILRVKEIHAEAMIQVNALLDEASTPYERAKAVCEIKKMTPHLKVPKEIVRRHRITSKVYYIGRKGPSFRKLLAYRCRRSGTWGRIDPNGLDALPSQMVCVNPAKDRIFYITPGPAARAFYSRINAWLKENRIESGTVFVIPYAPGTFGFKKLWTVLGRPPMDDMTDVSDLPAPPRMAAQLKPLRVMCVNGSPYSDTVFGDRQKYVDELNVEEGGVYIRSHGRGLFSQDVKEKDLSRDGMVTFHTAFQAMKWLHDRGQLLNPVTGQPVEEVVVVNGASRKAFIENDSAWVNLFDLARTEMQKAEDDLIDRYLQLQRGSVYENSFRDTEAQNLRTMAREVIADRVDIEDFPDCIQATISLIVDECINIAKNPHKNGDEDLLTREMGIIRQTASLLSFPTRISEVLSSTAEKTQWLRDRLISAAGLLADQYPVVSRWVFQSDPSTYRYYDKDVYKAQQLTPTTIRQLIFVMKALDTDVAKAYVADRTEEPEEGDQ